MHDDWIDRASTLGFTTNTLHASLTHKTDQSRVLDPSRVSVTDVCAELTEHRSTFDRRHVLQALAGHAHKGATVPELEAEADTLLAGPAVVPLGVGRFGICYSTPELSRLRNGSSTKLQRIWTMTNVVWSRTRLRRCSCTPNCPTNRQGW